MENINQSELRSIIRITGPDAEEDKVFLGFFVNFLKQIGVPDPSHPEILKFGLIILKKRRLFLPKFELPVVIPQTVDIVYGTLSPEIVWIGTFDNKQLFCHEISEGITLVPDIKIERKIRPVSTIIQQNINPLYASYLERYFQNKTSETK